MQVVLGVSMTPTEIRMVLVEGADGEGVTVDTRAVDLGPGDDAVRQVFDAVVGTRKSISADGHRLVSTGIVWTDHGQAARLRDALRTQGVADVVMVSELHAAGALAQAAGRSTGSQRTALLLVERDAATLAVVRTADGAVVGVHSRSLHAADASDVIERLADMTAALESSAEAPEAVFLVGSGVDVTSLSPRVAERTTLPVRAPGEADLALARGAALASASTPRFEATTVSIAPAAAGPDDLTAAGITQLGYSTPLGYSALGYSALADADADADAGEDGHLIASGGEPEQKPFLLVGSALASIFVVGIAALAISLAVTVRPAVEQRPESGAVPGAPVQPAVPTGKVSTAPQTISAPLPVVQDAPRTVVIPRPAAPVTVVAPAAPVAPAPAAPAPVPVAPPPAAPVVPAAVPAPLPAPVIPPIALTPILPALLPPVLQAPVRSTPVSRYPTASSVPAAPAEEPTYPTSSPVSSSSPPSAPPPSEPTTAASTADSTAAATTDVPTQVSSGSSTATTLLWPTPSPGSGDE